VANFACFLPACAKHDRSVRASYALPVLTCANCGEQNPEGARFCNACASPLQTDEGALREERKTVTVIFVDLVGFTAQAERLDPEDVRGVLSPYHAHVRAELERHGGTVEKFIGDAVMAVFGAPLVHEDDPERAVRAALAIRDWIAEQEDLQLRVAVNTGEALVSIGARPAEGEAMVAGDVVNTAARMQTAAPVNGVLVGESTYRATRDAIGYRDAEPVQAKGKSEPIRVWEAVEALARFGTDLSEGATSPLIGRDRELALLRSLLDRVREERSAHLVTLVGAPGIGKSRLVGELFRIVDREPELVTWRRGRCLQYGESVTFWALGEIVKAEAGILETDSAHEVERKLDRAVTRLSFEASDARWLSVALRALLSLTDDGSAGADAEAATAAWRRFLEAVAERGPAVLVFEDLHWADDGLLDFLDDLVDWLRSVPLLVVSTARPELLERRRAWGGGKANATTISLQPLAEDDTARLISALLEQPLQLADEQRILLDRAGGNPLFAEQYVRMLKERGTTGELPESVQGVIAARLDALPRREKELLHEAAVHGKVFWLGGVAAASSVDTSGAERLLRTLERKDFVRRERQSAVAGDTQYTFQHVLLRDVAYGQIPRHERRSIEARASGSKPLDARRTMQSCSHTTTDRRSSSRALPASRTIRIWWSVRGSRCGPRASERWRCRRTSRRLGSSPTRSRSPRRTIHPARGSCSSAPGRSSSWAEPVRSSSPRRWKRFVLRETSRDRLRRRRWPRASPIMSVTEPGPTSTSPSPSTPPPTGLFPVPAERP
jgi:class 3 adenylate cyclase